MQIAGRARERYALRLALGGGNDGLRVITLSGPPGAGSSTLARDAAWELTTAGDHVIWIDANRSATPAFAPPGSSRAAPRALAPAAATADPQTAATALADLLVRAVDQRPLRIFCDNAADLDAVSLLALEQLQQADDPNLSIVLVAATGHLALPPLAPLLQRLAQHMPLQQVAIDELEPAALVEIVAMHAGDELEPAEHELLARTAGGNPWLAVELARAARAGEGRWVPDTVLAWVDRQAELLDDDARQALNLLAVAGVSLPPDLLSRPTADVVDALVASALVDVAPDGSLAVRHPVVGAALCEALPAAKLDAHRAVLVMAMRAEALSIDTQAKLGRICADSGDLDAACAAYSAAIRLATLVGDPAQALQLADQALALQLSPPARIEILREASTIARLVHRSRAESLLGELLQLAAAGRDDEAYGFALEQLYWTSVDGGDLSRLQRAQWLNPDRVGWAARAAAAAAIADSDFELAARHDRRALELARDNEDRLLELRAAEKLAMAVSYLGDLPEAVELYSLARDGATELGLHRAHVTAAASLSDVLAEQLKAIASRAEADEALDYARSHALVAIEPACLAFCALARWRTGELAMAAKLADEAVTLALDGPLDDTAPLVADIRAGICLDRGLLEEATPLIEYSGELATASGDGSYLFEAQFTRARHAAALGNLDDALSLAATLDPGQHVALAQLALWLSRVAAARADTRFVEAAVARMREVADSTSPLCRLAGVEVSAVRDALIDGSDTSNVLLDCVAQWRGGGFELDAARTEATAGRCALSLELDSAGPLLSMAHQSLVRIGASADADAVAAQLRSLGQAPLGAGRRVSHDELTDRERRVAELAAGGLRNREIAERLHISESTVERHLRSSYGKLRIRNRAELLGALDQR